LVDLPVGAEKMIRRAEILDYQTVQGKAKLVLTQVGRLATPGMSEEDIANLCVNLLELEGITETWYYDVPAFVLAGDRSIISVSGRDYTPSSDVRLSQGDILTVDLSPSLNGRWGDCARSFCVGLDRYNALIQDGMDAEHELHRKLLAWVTPDKSFNDLYEYMNEEIAFLGFENLDFAGNLGHSVELSRKDRIYVESGNLKLLSDVSLFTFEPHIRKPGSQVGVKHENIYYFDDEGKLTEL
jgi:methionine aminopeptidase